MKPYTDDASPLDATFSVEESLGQLAVVLESRGGGSRPRNEDYSTALGLLLRRLAELDASVVDAVVDTRKTRMLPESERRILDAPMKLAGQSDLESVRRRLSASAAAVARDPDATGGGNPTRRVKLKVSVPGFGLVDASALENFLARTPREVEASHASVTGLLRELIGVELRTVSEQRPNTILAVRANEVIVATSDSRDGRPVAIQALVDAIVQLRRDGRVNVTVPSLGHRSAFIGAFLSQMPGTRVEGRAPARIVLDADSRIPEVELSTSEPPASIGPFQGALDRPISARQRREQRQLRAALLHNRSEAPCALCGESYPPRFLWASHIKKRSIATEEEVRDLPNVAMLACIFGCDALFEDGYVAVQAGRVVGTSAVNSDSAIGRRVAHLGGRTVAEYRRSATYFDWHLTNVFMA